MAALLFRLEQPHRPEEIAALINEVISWFRRHPDHEALKRLFTELVHQTIVGFGTALPIPEELTEMQTMMSRLPEIWKRQYLAEGEAKGQAEGEARGEIKGEAKALIRLAEQRFGPLSQALRARVENADATAIETWLAHLLAATNLETLFGTTN